MKAESRTVKQLFDGSHRYVVPAYQRPYVWEEEKQWEPLWFDIERLADARLEEREETHFLGAIVMRQEKSAPGGLTIWSVIDGQQRLATLQIVLAALSQAAEEAGASLESRKLRKRTEHDPDEAEGDERFRFWPTDINQSAYRAVMRGDDNHLTDQNNTIQEAWLFFKRQAEIYSLREDDGFTSSFFNKDTTPEERIAIKFAALHESIMDMMEVVVIQLGKKDRPQVVFETLNARGTPLLAVDLIKNALFEEAQELGLNIQKIHDEYWAPGLGDYKYWSKEDRLSNLRAPRSEIFIMQWLSMKLGKNLSSEAVFERFRKNFIDAECSPSLIDLMTEIRDDANRLRNLPNKSTDTPVGSLWRSCEQFGITSVIPLILLLDRLNLPNEGQKSFSCLESFFARRVLTRLQSSNYGSLNGDLLAAVAPYVKEKDMEGLEEALVQKLTSSERRGSKFPTDEEVSKALQEEPLYNYVGRKRIVYVFSRLEEVYRFQQGAEVQSLPKKIQIEHIMPQSWQREWPLSDNQKPEEREEFIHLLGNLTIVADKLNNRMSNASWQKKKTELLQGSVLLINQDLASLPEWSEINIQARGKKIIREIMLIWPGPEYFDPDYKKRQNARNNLHEDSARELLFISGPDAEGRGYISGKKFIVHKGSLARKKCAAGTKVATVKLRDELIKKGILKEIGSSYRFEEDYSFSSSSAAASAVLARSASGPQEWRNKKGLSLKEVKRQEKQ